MFSANACRARYSQLMSGTARIPCGIDDDPDARFAELEEFRLSREAARDKEADERETQEAMEKRVRDAARIESAQKAEETANKRATIEQEKANRALQRAAAAQLRSQKAAEIQKAKVERNAQIQKAASAPKKAASAPKKAASAPKKAASAPKKQPTAHATAGPSKPPTRKATAAAKIKQDPEPVDPRSYLNTIDLISMCADRGLTAKNTTKKELLATLIDADMEYTHDELRRMCKAKGIIPSGTKTVMRYQLAMNAAQMHASYQAALKTVGEDEGEDEDDMIVDAE